MANGFGSFYVGSSGLKNSQNALNTTANNMANVNTTGYVRQQVRFSDKHYITRNNPTAGTNIQQSGLGVSVSDVAHVRDIFLDKSYRQENHAVLPVIGVEFKDFLVRPALASLSVQVPGDVGRIVNDVDYRQNDCEYKV